MQKRGIKGDALLNAIDLSEEILSVNGDITEEYKKKKLLVNKQMIKTGSNDIPNLYGLKDAINKKESSSQYLADLDKIRKAYVQDVKENYSIDSIPDFSEKVNTSNEEIQFSREAGDKNTVTMTRGEAEKLYLKAAEAAGNRELILKILGERSEAEKAETNTEDANPDQNDKKHR